MNGWGAQHHKTQTQHNTTQQRKAKQNYYYYYYYLKKKRKKKGGIKEPTRAIFWVLYKPLPSHRFSLQPHIRQATPHPLRPVPFHFILSLSLSQQNSEPLCPPQPLWISEIDMWKLKLPLSYQLSLSQRYNYYLLVSLTFLFLVLYYIYNLTRVYYQIH